MVTTSSNDFSARKYDCSEMLHAVHANFLKHLPHLFALHVGGRGGLSPVSADVSF